MCLPILLWVPGSRDPWHLLVHLCQEVLLVHCNLALPAYPSPQQNHQTLATPENIRHSLKLLQYNKSPIHLYITMHKFYKHRVPENQFCKFILSSKIWMNENCSSLYHIPVYSIFLLNNLQLNMLTDIIWYWITLSNHLLVFQTDRALELGYVEQGDLAFHVAEGKGPVEVVYSCKVRCGF